MCIVELISTGDGQIMETLDYIGMKLCCVVPVSVQCRLCLVTVCVKVLHNGRILRFSKTKDCWCAFSWGICNQNGCFINCIQSSISMGVTTDTNHIIN